VPEPGLRFEVEDTGCGVPTDKAAILFEPFQQAAEYMNRPQEGSGLGLAIARTLVERMGGKIWFAEKSPPGAKVIFTIFLPRANQPAIPGPLADAVPQQPPDRFSGARVLLVEDNPDNVILMQAYLENCSLSLHLAANGLQAVEKRQCHDYDLVLMDIQLPIMDGYAATRAIREWEHSRGLQRVPILALTAHAFNGAAADSLQAGCDGHLTKPVERNELFEAMAKVMHPRQSARQAPGVVPQPVPADLSAADRSDADLSEAIRAQQPVFLSRRRADILKLREAIAVSDFATMQKIGHNCKGTGTGYGFPEISRLGLALEQAAKACDITLLATFVDRFERSVEAACESIL
jgi:CheY-like chemotaxis protein/HPt (histidine-containing phosphotransfer) domain-containing protein